MANTNTTTQTMEAGEKAASQNSANTKAAAVITQSTHWWINSEYVRVLLLVFILYCLGYFQASIVLTAIVGYALLYSHWTQLERIRTELEAKYLRYDKYPQLVRASFVADNIPKWVQHSEWEKCRFLNNIVEILWPSLNAAVETTLRYYVDPILQEIKPSYLSRLEFGIVNLGDIPMRIKSVKVIPKEHSPDEVIWDLDVDLSGGDATIGICAENKVVTLNAVLHAIEIKGTIRLVFTRFMNDWPLFDCIRIAFMGKPHLKYRLKAGNVPLSNIPGFVPWLNDLIQDSIKTLLMWPNELPIELGFSEAAVDGTNTAHPTGVLRVRVIEAKNLKNRDLFGKSDPMATVWINSPKYTTRKIKDTLNPAWDEIFEFVLNNKATDKLHVQVQDYNIGRKNQKLGDVHIDLQMLVDNIKHTQWYKLEGVTSGSIHIELYYSPFIKKQPHMSPPTKSEPTTSTTTPLPGYKSGHAMGHDLGSESLEVSSGDKGSPNVSASSLLQELAEGEMEEKKPADDGDSAVISASDVSQIVSIWEGNDSFRKLPKVSDVPEFEKPKTVRTPTKRAIIAHKLKKLAHMSSKNDFPSTDRRFDGVLRINIISAKNLKGMNRDGTSDPFVSIKVGERKFKTKAIRKTNQPVWNETFQLTVKEDEIKSDTLCITVKDREKWGKNGVLGAIEFKLIDIWSATTTISGEFKLQETTQGEIKLELDILTTNSPLDQDRSMTDLRAT